MCYKIYPNDDYSCRTAYYQTGFLYYLLNQYLGKIWGREQLLVPLNHMLKKYYTQSDEQDDLISIGTIGLIKAVDTFDPDKGKRFSSYASRCIENELRMELRRVRKAGVQVSLQEPLEAGGQLTLADTLPDDAEMEADCEQRADAARLRGLVDALPPRERAVMQMRYGFGGGPRTQQQTAQALGISRSYV